MRSRSTLVLAIVLVAIVGAVVWRALRGGSHASEDLTSVETSAGGQASNDITTDDEGTGAPRSAVREVADPPATAEETIWIRGRVLPPAEAPHALAGDPDLVVTARDPARQGRAFHRAGLDDEGEFRVGFPASETRGALTVEGRYLYLEDPVPVDLADPPGAEELVLEPRLGGRIHVALRGGVDPRTLTGVARLYVGDPRSWPPIASLPLGEPDFAFDALSTEALYAVVVDAEGLVPVEHTGLKVEAGRTLELEVAPSAGTRVSGWVWGNEPMPGAYLALASSSGETARTVSGARGEFHFDGVQPGDYVVRLTKAGYLPRTVDLTVRDDGESVWRLSERGTGHGQMTLLLVREGTITGTVQFANGTPEPETVVTAVDPRTKRVVRDTRSREDGTFELNDLPGGSLVVIASREVVDAPDELLYRAWTRTPDEWLPREPRSGWLWTSRAMEVSVGTPPLELTLEPGSQLTGHVIDDTGRAVEAFDVHVVYLEEPGLKWFSSFGNPVGGFVLRGTRAGRWRLYVYPKVDGLRPANVELELAQPNEKVEVVVRRSAALAGVVLDPEGSVAVGAEVTAQLLEEVAFGEETYLARRRTVVATSDETGSFHLADLDAGPVRLWAAREGSVASEVLALELAPGEVRGDVELRLRAGGSIAGTVRGPQGASLAREVVVRGDGYLVFRKVVAGEDGGFAVHDLPPGDYTVVLVERSDYDGLDVEALEAYLERHGDRLHPDEVEGIRKLLESAAGEAGSAAVSVTVTVRAGETARVALDR